MESYRSWSVNFLLETTYSSTIHRSSTDNTEILSTSVLISRGIILPVKHVLGVIYASGLRDEMKLGWIEKVGGI